MSQYFCRNLGITTTTDLQPVLQVIALGQGLQPLASCARFYRLAMLILMNECETSNGTTIFTFQKWVSLLEGRLGYHLKIE